jgi:GGDEF domain-containing protein
VTASFGVTSYPEVCADRDEVVQSADRAMYEAKRLGRNRVVAARPRHVEAPAAAAGLG